MTARLSDVARAAGVSQGTASNVFNRPEAVGPETRMKVLEAARLLGYRGPSAAGRLLRAGRADAVGVVSPDPLAYFFDDPADRVFLAGIAHVLDGAGKALTLISTADQAAAALTVRSALVDGFIVQCLEDGSDLVALARSRGLPMVVVDNDRVADASAVVVDDRRGAFLAAHHILMRGHRRIGVLSLEMRGDGATGRVDAARLAQPTYAVARMRLAGYADALAGWKIPLDTLPIFEVVNEPNSIRAGVAALFAEAPDTTAVLAMSDLAALVAIAFLKETGRRVPQDVSVVGYDDMPEAARADPPLTTVRQALGEKGALAARLLLEPEPSPRVHVLPVELVERASVADR